jgi:hypothetical protein
MIGQFWQKWLPSMGFIAPPHSPSSRDCHLFPPARSELAFSSAPLFFPTRFQQIPALTSAGTLKAWKAGKEKIREDNGT